MNATVKVTTVTQAGNEVLGTKDKTLWYVIIETDKGKMNIGIGETNYNKLQDLLSIKKGGK